VPVHVVEVGDESARARPLCGVEVARGDLRIVAGHCRDGDGVERVPRRLERHPLREVRLDVLGGVEHADLRLRAVGVGVVGVVGVEADERDGELELLALGSGSERLVRLDEVGELGLLAHVHELADAERLAGIVDERVPAQLHAHVLHLDPDLAHFAAQLVVDQPR